MTLSAFARRTHEGGRRLLRFDGGTRTVDEKGATMSAEEMTTAMNTDRKDMTGILRGARAMIQREPPVCGCRKSGGGTLLSFSG